MAAPVFTSPAIAGAAVGAAGFAAGRMLLFAPDRALLDRFALPADRSSWPIRNSSTMVALKILAEPFSADAVRAEWNLLFDDGPRPIRLRESEVAWLVPSGLVAGLERRYAGSGFARSHEGAAPVDHLGVELTYLAHVASLVGRGVTSGDAEAAALSRAELVDFRRAHVDGFAASVLDEIAARAAAPPLRALPFLVAGFLEAVAELAGVSGSSGASGASGASGW